jgi:hypothetical protein
MALLDRIRQLRAVRCRTVATGCRGQPPTIPAQAGRVKGCSNSKEYIFALLGIAKREGYDAGR